MKTQRAGYGLFAALVALVLLISGAIVTSLTVLGADDRRQTASGAGTGGRSGKTTARTVGTGGWAGSWSAAPGKAGVAPAGGHSVRNVVHTSIGGSEARITLSNLYGTEPLRIGSASIAVAAQGAAAAPGSLRRVLFDGRPSATVPAGGHVLGDPVRLAVPADGHLLVSLFVPPPGGGTVTLHPRARQTSYLAVGDRTRDAGASAYTRRTSSWHHLTAVDVRNPAARGTVVALGDSLTDGAGSTPDADRRWTDHLADRLRSGRWGYGVVNQGISGNRLLRDGVGPSGLSRLDRDVAGRPGARVVVIALGVNDLLRPAGRANPAEVTAGLRSLAERARARGLRVVGATLMPFRGHPRYGPELDAAREEINTAIRAGGVFDAVVDFDRALRDPYAPERLHPAYDSGDHLHPNDAGYERMARSVDLSVLTGEGEAARL
ncbi:MULTISPECIES: SGNH/GDSL hydrolase family protein [unclassified Streptomyces]|uniref:SGNH/GDSL hydrolase family protein n=1 Tax=unclassified Streptomyces TaxID=2593676 RepID=UPI000F44CE80|nr:SGNH/GDSL hydrolase family protein [Streptomyces sp. I6]RNL71277.1 SGNH/GDSL hydrolase family protein [Streptomyces sp. I6]